MKECFDTKLTSGSSELKSIPFFPLLSYTHWKSRNSCWSSSLEDSAFRWIRFYEGAKVKFEKLYLVQPGVEEGCFGGLTSWLPSKAHSETPKLQGLKLNLLNFLLDFEFLFLPSLVTFPVLPSPLAIKVGDSALTNFARSTHLKVQKIVSDC